MIKIERSMGKRAVLPNLGWFWTRLHLILLSHFCPLEIALLPPPLMHDPFDFVGQIRARGSPEPRGAWRSGLRVATSLCFFFPPLPLRLPFPGGALSPWDRDKKHPGAAASPSLTFRKWARARVSGSVECLSFGAPVAESGLATRSPRHIVAGLSVPLTAPLMPYSSESLLPDCRCLSSRRTGASQRDWHGGFFFLPAHSSLASTLGAASGVGTAYHE